MDTKPSFYSPPPQVLVFYTSFQFCVHVILVIKKLEEDGEPVMPIGGAASPVDEEY